MILPAGASAAKAVYHPKKEARDFAKGDGHWKGGTSFSGLCISGLTCPDVTNAYEPSDGAGHRGGSLRTTISSLAGTQTTSRGTFTSPAFTYKGIDGAKAKKVSFRLSRSSSLAPLLAVVGNSATYSVDLLDKSNGSSTTIVSKQPLADTNGWTNVKPVSLKASGMKIGHRYKLRITSEFITGVVVVDGGYTAYDNVKLVARGPKGATGGPGGDGPGSGAIGGGIKPAKSSHDGRRIKVPYHCPKSTKPSACNAKLSVSLSRKGKAVTRNRTVRVRPGHRRTATLKVRTGHRHQVAKRGKVFVHARVRAKGHVYHVTRKVKVHRKG